MTESGLPFHPDLDMASNVCVLVAESFLQVRDHVEPRTPRPELGAMFRAALVHPDHVLNPAVQPGTVAALRSTAERGGASAVLEAELTREARMRWPRRAWVAGKLVAWGNPLLDCSKRGVTNIYEATLAADDFLSGEDHVGGARLYSVRGRMTKVRRSLQASRARLGG